MQRRRSLLSRQAGRGGLDRGLCGGRPWAARTCPLRPRQENLRSLPRRGWRALRDRRRLHARQYPPFRRPGEGRHDRVPEAQRAVQPYGRLARAAAGLPRPRDLSDRGAQRPHLLSTSPRPAGRARAAEDLSVPRRQQPERRDIHQGAGPRTSGPGRNVSFTPGDYLQLDIPAYDEIRFRDFDIPAALRRRLGAPARLRPCRPQPRGRPPQQLLARQQPEAGAHAALQRAHRHAAAGPGLPAGRRVQLTYSASSLATSFPPSARSAISTSGPRSARWSTSAGAPAWRRCAPSSRTSSRPSARPAR